MTRRPFPTTPAYLQSLRGLHRLHALTVAGLSQSPEADALRDSLEGPWYALSEAEQQRISGLSEDLYSLSEPPAEPSPANPQATSRISEAFEARQAGDWDRALGLLRRWGRYFDPAHVAYLRGSLWLEAGDAATATLFLRHATDVQNTNEKFFLMYLFALEKSSPDDALRRVGEIIASNESTPPIIIAWAGPLLLKFLPSMGITDRLEALQRFAHRAKQGFEQLQASESNSIFQRKEILIILAQCLASCYKELGNTGEAIRYLDMGIAAVPDHPDLFLVRGIMRYGRGELGAVDDIELAIRLGLGNVWPYFFLSYHYLVTGRFDDCLKMCDRALIYTATDDVKARLHEWRAIARSELGFPAEMVRSEFEEALRLVPEDDQIRRNFDLFRRSGGQPGARPHDWATPKASAVQALYRAEPGPLMPAA